MEGLTNNLRKRILFAFIITFAMLLPFTIYIRTYAKNQQAIKGITYNDELKKEVVYGKVKFAISPYHVVSTKEKDGYIDFYCELDKGEIEGDQSRNFRIKKADNADIKTFDGATKYFDKTIEYSRLSNYENIVDASGITKMYVAIGEEGQLSYYICFYQNETYIIETEDKYLTMELVKGDISDFVKNVIYVDKIEVKGKIDKKVVENVSYQARKADYEIFSSEGILEYKAKLKMTKLKKGKERYQYSYKVYDTNNKQLQELIWKSTALVYPKFLDLNQDGSVDLQIVVDQTPGYDIKKLYVWNDKKQCYQKVIYTDVLAEIEVNDGYLLNWVRSGTGGYVIEKLRWNGNKLIKDSEELAMPEE